QSKSTYKMYREEFLRVLNFRLRICKQLQCVPFEFDQQSGRLIKTKSSRLIRIFKLQCALSAMYCTAMFANICFGPLTTSGRLQGFAIFLTCLAGTIARWNYSIDISPVQIINAFLDFEARITESLPKMPISLGTKAIKTFIYLVELGVFLYSIFVFTLLRFLPCTPPFILSMFENCGSDEVPGSYRVKLGVHIFETWMGSHITYSGTTWIQYVLFVGICFILHNFQLLNR
ncbi:hypothetical protein Fcan01_24377, partial [Folsomia candida]